MDTYVFQNVIKKTFSTVAALPCSNERMNHASSLRYNRGPIAEAESDKGVGVRAEQTCQSRRSEGGGGGAG